MTYLEAWQYVHKLICTEGLVDKEFKEHMDKVCEAFRLINNACTLANNNSLKCI